MNRLGGIAARWFAWWGFWVAICAIGVDQAWVFAKMGDPPPLYRLAGPIECWSTMMYLVLPVVRLWPTAADAGGNAWMTFLMCWCAVFAALIVVACERLHPRSAARVTVVVLGSTVAALVVLRLVAWIPPVETTGSVVMAVSGIGLALLVFAAQLYVVVGLVAMVVTTLRKRLERGASPAG
ncbi:MAG: hypothetical protein ACHQ52_07315 [Candidatus Eisenbacteria bacterium]